MALEELEIIGSNSSFITDETKKELGELLAYLLYHELDKAIAMLLVLDSTMLRELEFAAHKLIVLCTVAKKED